MELRFTMAAEQNGIQKCKIWQLSHSIHQIKQLLFLLREEAWGEFGVKDSKNFLQSNTTVVRVNLMPPFLSLCNLAIMYYENSFFNNKTFNIS